MVYRTIDYVEPLAEKLFLVNAPENARFPFSNSFLLTGSETVLIDTGIGKERILELDRARRIDVLVISHSHPDHILAWNVLKDRHLLLPKETPDAVQDLKTLGTRFTGSERNGEYWAKFVGNGLGIHALRPPDGRFGDGGRIDFGGACLEAVHAPGHLRDHYCFYETRSRTLLTTDIDLTGFGPWYGNPEGDVERFAADIRNLMGHPCDRVCSSHKAPIEGSAQADFSAFLESLNRQQEQVRIACGTGRTLEELAASSPFYRDRLPDKTIQNIFETNMIRKQLSLLMRDGLVALSDGQYRALE